MADISAPHLKDFEAIITGPLAAHQAASEIIGGVVKQQVDLVVTAFKKEYDFLIEAAKTAKPADDKVQAMVGPVGELIGKVQALCADTPPRDPLFNHLSAWSESIPALGWVMVDSKAVSYVADMEGAGEFYTSKVLMTFKKSDNFKPHQDWVNSFKAVFADFKAYVKAHHTMKLEWNKGVSGGAKGKAAAAANDDDDDGDAGGNDPLSAFASIITGPVQAYVDASSKVGGEVEKQAKLFLQGFNHELDFLKKAATMAKPADVQSMLGDIGADIGKIAEFAQTVLPKDPMINHVTAIAESVGVLGWVALDSGAVSYIGDMEGAADFYLSKVLVAAKKSATPEIGQNWVKSVKDMYSALKAYIKEHFTMALTWNFASMAAKKQPKKKKPVEDDDEDSAFQVVDPIALFKAIMEKEVKAYEAACHKIGGEVAKQGDLFVKGWVKELEFLEKAGKLQKPAKPEDIQAMLGEVGALMGSVGEIASGMNSRDKFFNHCTAISESVGVLGWVLVDSKPVGYINDMEGAGEFYLSKVLVTFKKADDAADHQAFVQSVKDLYNALKNYVKEHFTTGLTWNFTTNKPIKRNMSARRSSRSFIATKSSVDEFKAIIDGPIQRYNELCGKIGGSVQQQASSVLMAFNEELVFLTKAAQMPKPKSQEEIMGMLGTIGAAIGKVQELQNSVAPRDPFVNHLTAMGETIPALSWVVIDSKPVGFVGDMEGAGDFYLNRVLADYKKADNAALHQDWVKTVREIFAEMKAFVKAHHTTGLQWNTGLGGSLLGPEPHPAEEVASGGTVVGDFENLIKGPVTKYMDVSKKIGSHVEVQAQKYVEVWNKELEFIKQASSMKRPSDDEVQKMITPVGMAMGAVNDVKDGAPPRDELVNHLTAMAESVPALGWIALDSKPVAYVSEMAGAGEMYLNRVLTQFKNHANVALHKEWVAAVKEIYDELKKYIKQWHTQKLSWKA